MWGDAEKSSESAIKWCDTGFKWLRGGAVRMGTEYIDRATAVFRRTVENDSAHQSEGLGWLTYALHGKLTSLLLSDKQYEVEPVFEELMHNYLQLNTPHNRAVALVQRAYAMISEGALDMAQAQLNLAETLVRHYELAELTNLVCLAQAELAQDNSQALLCIDYARHRHNDGNIDEAIYQLILLEADALSLIGQRPVAIAIIEELAQGLVEQRMYFQAIQVLHRLRRLYGQSGTEQENARIEEVLNYCNQSHLKGLGLPMAKANIIDWLQRPTD